MRAFILNVFAAFLPLFCIDGASAAESGLEMKEIKITDGEKIILTAVLNDTETALEALIAFTRNLMCHVNLIPLNAVDHSSLKPSAQNVIEHWQKTLSSAGIETTVRNSRGGDIDGACGQLKNKLARSN